MLFALIGVPAYIFVIYLNKKDQTHWGLSLMFVVGAVLLAIFSLRNGEESMTHMLFILNIIGLPLLYRKGKMRTFYWLNMAFTLICLVFVMVAFEFNFFSDFQYDEVDPVADRKIHMLFLASSAIVFSIVSVSSFSTQYRRLKKAVDDKDVLLAELNHRVKNNLSIIVSLLRLKQGISENEETKDALRDIGNRIHSMALVHRQMYQGTGRSYVHVPSYFDELMDGICASLGDHPDIHCEKRIDDTTVDVSTAIPLGMILNELIMNSLKHAFGDIDHPTIEIEFRDNQDSIELVFSDNGAGMDESEANMGESLGLELIHSLCDQLDGSCEYESYKGLTFTMTFPKSKLS